MTRNRAFWAILDQGIGPFFALLATPVFLRIFSQTEFAVWVLAMTLIGMSQLISVGLPPICTREAAVDIAHNNAQKLGAILGSALTAVAVVGAAVALPVFLFSDVIAATFFSALGPVWVVSTGIKLAVVIALTQELETVVVSGLKADEQFGFSAKVELVSRVLLYAILLTVAVLSASVLAALGAYVVAALGKMSVKAYALKRHFRMKNQRSLVLSFVPQQLYDLLAFSKWQWVQSISGVTYTSADRLLIASFLGPGQLNVYAIALTLTQQTHALVASASQILIPMIAKRIAQNAHEVLRILNGATLAALLVPLPIHLLLFTQGDWLVQAWTHSTHSPEVFLIIKILTVNFAVLCLNAPAYFTLIALGETRVATLVILASALAQLLASVLTIEQGLAFYSMSRLVYAVGTLSLYYVARKSILKRRPSM